MTSNSELNDSVFHFLQKSTISEVRAFAKKEPKKAEKQSQKALEVLKELSKEKNATVYEDLKIKSWILSPKNDSRALNALSEIDVSKLSPEVKKGLITDIDLSHSQSRQIYQKLLFDAIENQDVKSVEALAVKGIYTYAGKYGYTPLQVAILSKSPSLEIIEILIRNGVSLDEVDENGDTPLLTALFSNSPSPAIIDTLLKGGASPNQPDALGNTPLHSAILSKSPSLEIIDVLLKNGASLKEKDADGDTPLHTAILSNSPSLEVIERLLEYDAPLDAIDGGGNIPLQTAILSNTPTEITQSLLKNTPSTLIDAKNSKGDTPLLAEIRSKNASLEVIEELLKKGASLEAKDSNGYTPLHLAVFSNSYPIVKLLLTHGARPDITGKDGDTPLHIALKSPSLSPEIIDLLLKKGADPDQINNQGETCSFLAECRSVDMPTKNQSYNEEFAYRLLLANSWGIAHTTQIAEKTVNLEGSHSYLAYRSHLNLLKKFIDHPSQDADLHEFSKLYESSFLNGREPASIVQEKFAKGETFTFLTGWAGHAISVTFHGDYMIVANRGDNRKPEPLKIYKIDRSKSLSVDLVLALQEKKVLQSEEGADFFYNKLPQMLGSDETGPDLLINLMNKECQQADQKMGNCWWIAPKAGMFALLALEGFLDAKKQGNFDDDIIKAVFLENFALAQDIYKQFSEFTRVELIKEYTARPLDGIGRDYELIKRIRDEKLNSKNWKHIFEKEISSASSDKYRPFFTKEEINKDIEEFLKSQIL